MEIRLFKKIYLALFPASFVLAHWALQLTGSPDKTAKLFFLVCPLHFFTGLLCPTCGLGRSLVLTWTGSFETAIHFHFLGPLILLAGAICWLALLFKINLSFTKAWTKPLSLSRFPLLAMIALYTVWGVWRNFHPGEWL